MNYAERFKYENVVSSRRLTPLSANYALENMCKFEFTTNQVGLSFN